MHAATDPRLVRCLDALYMSFQMLETLQIELYPICTEIPTKRDSLHRAFMIAWTIVDTSHRIREVAQCVPGLSGSTPELRLLMQKTHIAEQLRHYIQHLRSELSRQPGNPFPVWGNLSWVDPDDRTACHTALAGAELPGVSHGSCVFDTLAERWVSNVTLSIGTLVFSVDSVVEACLDFRGFIIPWIRSTYSPGVTFQKRVPIFTTRFQAVARNLLERSQSEVGPTQAAEEQ